MHSPTPPHPTRRPRRARARPARYWPLPWATRATGAHRIASSPGVTSQLCCAPSGVLTLSDARPARSPSSGVHHTSSAASPARCGHVATTPPPVQRARASIAEGTVPGGDALLLSRVTEEPGPCGRVHEEQHRLACGRGRHAPYLRMRASFSRHSSTSAAGPRLLAMSRAANNASWRCQAVWSPKLHCPPAPPPPNYEAAQSRSSSGPRPLAPLSDPGCPPTVPLTGAWPAWRSPSPHTIRPPHTHTARLAQWTPTSGELRGASQAAGALHTPDFATAPRVRPVGSSSGRPWCCER